MDGAPDPRFLRFYAMRSGHSATDDIRHVPEVTRANTFLLLCQVRESHGFDQRHLAPNLIVGDRQRRPGSQAGGNLNRIRGSQSLARAQPRGIQQDVASNGYDFEVRKMVEQQLVIVRNILPPELQRSHGQFEQGQLRGDAPELAFLKAFDYPARRPSKLRMLLEMIDPHARVDEHSLVTTGESHTYQSLRSSCR